MNLAVYNALGRQAKRPRGHSHTKTPKPQERNLVAVYTTRAPGASAFEILREEIPLQNLLEANGQGKAKCVAHDDENPSMHLYDDYGHCFSCGFHGDVVDIWSRIRGSSDRPIEAALELAKEFNVTLPEMSEETRRAVAE